MTRILAIDPATLCGFAHSNGHHGVWSLGEASEGQGRRLIRLRSLIHGAAKMWGIDRIAAEAASFGSKFASTQQFHNELRGVMRLVAAEIGAEFYELKPTTIKKFATGSGRAEKQQMIAACKRLLGIEARDSNEADALFILEAAKQNYQPPPSMKKRRQAEKMFFKKQPKLFR